MVQLPIYVDRILAGGRDIPLVLLPLLNDLRAARGRRLLSEGTLLLLNLGKKPTEADSVERRKPSGEVFALLILRVHVHRQFFHFNIFQHCRSGI